MAEDSQGLVYLPERAQCHRKRCAANDVPFEAEDWVPAPAYYELIKFQEDSPEHSGEVKKLFTQVNIAWKEREKKRMARLRTKYERRVNSVKRRRYKSTTGLQEVYQDCSQKAVRSLTNAIEADSGLRQVVTTLVLGLLKEFKEKLQGTLQIN